MEWLYRFDMEVFRAVHVGWHSPALDVVFLVFSYLGLGQVEALFAIALLFRRDTRYYTLPMVLTVLASSFSAQIPKHLLDRERPSRLAFAHPQEAWVANSFPSGHTTSAFAFAFMALFLTMGTKRAWVGWWCLAFAVMVGISRIYRGVHWPSDVIAGICFGCITAAGVYFALDGLGHLTHLDQPEATLTGREVSEADGTGTLSG